MPDDGDRERRCLRKWGTTHDELPSLRSVGLKWEQVVVEAVENVGLGRWWAEALGWVVVNDDPIEFEIRPSPEQMPGLLFLPATAGKSTKNRLHLDFRPDDQQAEVRGWSSGRRCDRSPPSVVRCRSHRLEAR